MKIRYFSDLHLEFMKQGFPQIPSGMDEICILAGDIGNPYQANYDTFMQFISKNFKKTFVISGNHEYYNNTIQETNEFMKDYFQQFHNIRFLNNSYEIYNNYCFIGTTLWSNITNPLYEINDVHRILHFDYIQYNQLHKRSVDFLKEALQNENCIVITHHVPSESLVDVKYKTPQMQPYNQWFYCDMDELFTSNIKCWIYGHTHTPSNVIKNGIPFLCNPIGYPNENRTSDFQKSVTIHPNTV